MPISCSRVTRRLQDDGRDPCTQRLGGIEHDRILAVDTRGQPCRFRRVGVAVRIDAAPRYTDPDECSESEQDGGAANHETPT